MTQSFRDHTGKLVAFTRSDTAGSGRASVYNGRGEFVGYLQSETTRTPDGCLVTTGRNPLTLIPDFENGVNKNKKAF